MNVSLVDVEKIRAKWEAKVAGWRGRGQPPTWDVFLERRVGRVERKLAKKAATAEVPAGGAGSAPAPAPRAARGGGRARAALTLETAIAAIKRLAVGTECPVCYEDIGEDCGITPCGHVLCSACLTHTLGTTAPRCPCCRGWMGEGPEPVAPVRTPPVVAAAAVVEVVGEPLSVEDLMAESAGSESDDE